MGPTAPTEPAKDGKNGELKHAEKEPETVTAIETDVKAEVVQKAKVQETGANVTKTLSVFERIDAGLAAHYESCGREDYVDEEGLGKFSEFCEINGFEDKDVDAQLGEEATPDDCLMLDVDYE